MRKILLAGVAMVVATGVAMAADTSGPLLVTATVAESCSFTTPLTNNPISGTTSGSFGTAGADHTCNFSGTGTTPLSVTVKSALGALVNPLDSTPRSYTIKYHTFPVANASAYTGAGQIFADTSNAANTNSPRSWTATLAENLPVAGTYSDTVTISIAP